MGYDVHITRAADWLDAAEFPILEADWQRLVSTDLTLELSTTDYHERTTQAGTVERIYAVLWLPHPDQPSFILEDGEIVLKDPDEATIEKMVKVATQLGARVFGDDGEEYS